MASLININYNTLKLTCLVIFSVLFAFHSLVLLGIANVSDLVSTRSTNQITHILHSFLAIVAALGISKKDLPFWERGFWFSLTLALMIWISTKLGLLLAQLFDFSAWIFIVANYGYFAFFLCFLFALQLLSPGDVHQKEGTFHYSLNQWLSLIFMGFMFVYLIVISPQSQNPKNEQDYASFLFYITMDIFLLSMCLRQAINSEKKGWPNRLVWFALTFTLYLLLDTLELLARTGYLPLNFDSVVTILWYLPYLTLLLGICASPSGSTGSGNVHLNALKKIKAQLPAASIVLLLSLPLLHFIGYRFAFFSSELKDSREIILIVWLLLYSLYLYISTRSQHHGESASAPVDTADTVADKPHSQLSTVPFPCLMLNQKGLIEYCNPAAENLFGYNRDALTNKHFSGLLDKDEPLSELLRHSETSFSDSQLITNDLREVHCHHKQGQKLYCYIAFGKSKANMTLVSLVDITRLHDAEVQALSIKDRFLANITHEFRTPLTIIQGVIDEGLDKEQDEQFHKRLSAAKSNSLRVLKMVEQLLNLSKLTSAPKIDLIPQSASQIIYESCRQFENLCQQKSIRFQFEVEKDIWIKVHEDALQQVLYNLLSNAYKYSDPQSQISLQASVSNQRLQIVIADNGYGMTREEQSKLFHRFQRADSAKSSSTFGVGIGLSLVSELAAIHEWQISVNSELNRGSTFTLTIATSNAPSHHSGDTKAVDFYAEQNITKRTSNQQTKAEISDKTNEVKNRLLIIEDNPDMQDHLAHLLKSQYQLDVQGTGQGGIDAAIKDIPDVIICDLMLPDLSGFSVIEQLKSHELTQHIPIIMLTAKADTQSKLQGLEKQADDYLTKPFDHRELQLRLSNLLNLREKIQQVLRAQLNNHLSQEVHSSLPQDSEQLQVLPHQNFLNKLQNVAEKHYTREDFTTAQLASDMAVSERQLQRKLKAAMNITPGEYLREFRLIKARELLKSGMSVGLVSDSVGFSSQNYFARCFKTQTGQTPSEFQKSVTN